MLVNTYYAPEIFGGAEYSVKKLAEELQRQGHTVRVLCTGKQYTEEVVDGISVVRLKVNAICRANETHKQVRWKRLLHRLQDIWNPTNCKMLEKQLDVFSPDVIHTNGLYDISPIVWKIAHKKNIRIVHTLRDYYLMCPRVSLDCERMSNGAKTPFLACEFHKILNRNHSRYVDCVTAPSKITLNRLLEDGFFKQAETKVIPNAIEIDEAMTASILEIRAQRLTSKKAVSFIYLGTLSAHKGIQWMIESFQAIADKDIKLIIAGKGDLKTYVEECMQKDNRIQFVGFLAESAMNKQLQEADVLLCPSQWEEPFGRVVLDAYKAAIPAIVSDRGALPELVENSETGFVVTSGDRVLLSERLRFYIENHENMYKHGVNANQKLKEFDLRTQAELFARLYNEV